MPRQGIAKLYHKFELLVPPYVVAIKSGTFVPVRVWV